MNCIENSHEADDKPCKLSLPSTLTLLHPILSYKRVAGCAVLELGSSHLQDPGIQRDVERKTQKLQKQVFCYPPVAMARC